MERFLDRESVKEQLVRHRSSYRENVRERFVVVRERNLSVCRKFCQENLENQRYYQAK